MPSSILTLTAASNAKDARPIWTGVPDCKPQRDELAATAEYVSGSASTAGPIREPECIGVPDATNDADDADADDGDEHGHGGAERERDAAERDAPS